MRITKTQLIQIIKEELSEAAYPSGMTGPTAPVSDYDEALNALMDYAEDLKDDNLTRLIGDYVTVVDQRMRDESMNDAKPKLKDFIKTGKIDSTIPAGSLAKVLGKKPELSKAAKNAEDRQGQMEAFQQIAALLAQEPDIKRAIGDDPLEKHLDVKGFLRYAAMYMRHLF